VLYEERDAVAFVTINRPEKKNTMTEAVIQGIADGIDRANSSVEARAVVLRGTGGVFCAGYDLAGGYDWRDETGWQKTFDAPRPEPRAGAWDPVRDLAFMGHNVARFMKIWESPKPVIAQIEGWAVGGATDLALCCDQLFMADTAVIGYPPSRIFGTPTTMLWVYRLGLEALNKLLINQAFENMGLRTTQLLGTFFDGVTRHTEEAYRWVESFEEKGFCQVIRDRDRPWADYGEKGTSGGE
ncbi:MAG: enoyl-CoA hydratase-related protein, partial [Acidimicrobiia bacterium]